MSQDSSSGLVYIALSFMGTCPGGISRDFEESWVL